MYVVAVWGQRGQAAVVPSNLATVLGTTLYEARLRLRGPGPAIVSRFAQLAQARACVSSLGLNGIYAVVVDVSDNGQGPPDKLVVRAFELTDEALVALDRNGNATLTLPYPEIRLLLHAMERHPQLTMKTTERRQLALGRALLSGGLMITKSKKQREQVAVENPEAVLQIWDSSGPRCELHESTVDFRGLEERLDPSRSANFLRTIAVLRERCPEAVYDARLLDRTTVSQVVGSGFAPAAVTSIALAVLGSSLSQHGVQATDPA